MPLQQAILSHSAQAANRPRYRAASFQLSFATAWPRTERMRPAPRQPIHREPIVQLVLALETSKQITPLMETVERVLRRIAFSRQPMPNNPVLGTLAGDRSRASVLKALERLGRLGRLRIEKETGRRRVVFKDGTATGWGEARPGHAPYSRDPATPQPVARSAVILAFTADYKPPPPVVVGPSPKCQWPLWSNGRSPDMRFCEGPSLPGRSWCAAHFPMIFTEAPELKARRHG